MGQRGTPCSPAIGDHLSNYITIGAPDDCLWAFESSKSNKKPLVGEWSSDGFRVREKHLLRTRGRYLPTALATFTPTPKGTRMECRFLGTGVLRAVYLCVMLPVMLFLVAMGITKLYSKPEEGGIMLLFIGLMALTLALFYWGLRNSFGELKDELDNAIRRSVLAAAPRTRPRR